jgi:ribonucleoside-diphosphate reductase alpha chain
MIFLDRYALKDMTKKSLSIGDMVIVCVNQKTRQREVGSVKAIKGDRIEIELRDGTMTEQAWKMSTSLWKRTPEAR